MESEKLDEISKTLNRFINSQEVHNIRVNNFINSQERQNFKVLEDLGTINRGVYGDEPNGVEGLITRQDGTEKDVTKLKSSQVKAIAWGSGFVVGVNVIIFIIKEFFAKS
jgi:hypothetical protein